MARRLSLLQETVQKTERLRLLGQVSGGLAHQLRNSAAGARLAVQVHLRECSGHGDTEALEVALRQLDLLESNLKRFLELGRSGALRLEACSVLTLLDHVVSLFGPQSRHKHVELHWDRPATDIMVRADAGQLTQALINLLDNALTAAGPEGTVQIAAFESVPPAAQQPMCILEVRDSGPGPPADIAPRLFEPFVTAKPEGVGLGLAVSRQIAEAHGGRLTWERDGKCTVFRLVIPR
jgi:signal transduction histidine kinase